MTSEEIIKKYRLGPDSRIKFKDDPQQYWIKNISPNRKEVFIHINGAQTYRKLIKNIIQVGNQKLLEKKEVFYDEDTGESVEFDTDDIPKNIPSKSNKSRIPKEKTYNKRRMKGNNDDLKSIVKEVLKDKTQKPLESKGDISLLSKIFKNQLSDPRNWPQIKLKTKEKDGDIHVELEPEEIVFVFNSEGKLKGVLCYKD